jgi:hypothetical protein
LETFNYFIEYTKRRRRKKQLKKEKGCHPIHVCKHEFYIHRHTWAIGHLPHALVFNYKLSPSFKPLSPLETRRERERKRERESRERNKGKP